MTDILDTQKPSYLKVEGSSSLVRDTSNSVIVNTDVGSYNAYIANRRRLRDKDAVLAEQANEIAAMKEELSEIKSLLKKLVS